MNLLLFEQRGDPVMSYTYTFSNMYFGMLLAGGDLGIYISINPSWTTSSVLSEQ